MHSKLTINNNHFTVGEVKKTSVLEELTKYGDLFCEQCNFI